MLAGALLASACNPPGQAQKVEFRVPVTVAEVTTGRVEDRVVATGTLRAPETVVLRTETAGTLVVASAAGSGKPFAEGDRVEAGQVIADVTGEEVRLAARTDATRQRYQTVLRDHESAQRLHDQGLLSEQAFSALEAQLAEALIELERSRLTEVRSHLVTPIAGVILRLTRDERTQRLANGQLVPQGFEVALIAPVDTLVADVDLVGLDLARVRPDLEARVRHHAWDDRTFRGTVLRLAPTLDPVTRTLRAEVAVDNADGLLRPGMFVEVTIVTDARDDVPIVPREAVTERGGRKVVFVLDGQRVFRRDVGVGLGDDDVVEIRSGLEPGERIVVRGLETLTDDQPVRVSGS